MLTVKMLNVAPQLVGYCTRQAMIDDHAAKMAWKHGDDNQARKLTARAVELRRIARQAQEQPK